MARPGPVEAAHPPQARGVEVEYLVKDNEGHGFVDPDNNIDMYRAADRFLARHLKPRPDTE